MIVPGLCQKGLLYCDDHTLESKVGIGSLPSEAYKSGTLYCCNLSEKTIDMIKTSEFQNSTLFREI